MTIPDTAKSSSGMTAPIGGGGVGGMQRLSHLPELQPSRESKHYSCTPSTPWCLLEEAAKWEKEKGTPKQNIVIASRGHFK